jgi:hypothetical protein
MLEPRLAPRINVLVKECVIGAPLFVSILEATAAEFALLVAKTVNIEFR